MDEKEQTETLQDLNNWEGDLDESSPAELLTFVFQEKQDYDTFCKEMVDNRNYKVFARFEKWFVLVDLYSSTTLQ